MAGKIIKFDKDARAAIKNGVDKLAKAVGITIGPRGRNVTISRSWSMLPHVTKDGISVCREIHLKDEFENMGVQLVRAAAQRTCDDAGDGTSASTLLSSAIYNKGLQLLTVGFNPIPLKRGIDKAVAAVVDHLDTLAQPTQDPEKITQIGSISANDPDLGKIVADAMDKVGQEGVVTIDESSTMETYLEVSKGLSFDRGYFSPWFITNVEKTQVEFTDAYVLIHEERLEDINSLINLINDIAREGKPLLIIAEDYGQSFMSTLIFNKRKGSLFSCPVKAPGFGERRKEILKDLAVLTGATPFSKDLGTDLSQCTINDLGTAKKVTVNRAETVIVSGGGSVGDIKARVNQIRDDIKHCDSEYDRDKMKERLAKLTGGIAVIRVGSATEVEMKEKKDRVEDALHSTRAAVAEGIVAGGGVALLRCRETVQKLIDTLDDNEEKSGAEIVLDALDAPLKMIVSNAGGSPDTVISKIIENDNPNFGYNAATGKFEDLIESGVIDPKKVVRCALQNAASVASMLITTEAMVADDPDDKDEEGNSSL